MEPEFSQAVIPNRVDFAPESAQWDDA
jgi:hypothetical protein